MRRLIALATVAALAACSSGSSKSAPETTTEAPQTTATRPIDYGAQYIRLTAAANKAGETFNASTAALPDSATIDDLARLAAPVAKAFDDLDQALLRAQWPPEARQDIKNLVAANAVLIADLENVKSQTLDSIQTWKDQLTQAIGRTKGQVDIVRADLGLPPK